MASAIRQMTGVGGDVRKIARLLQKKAPPGHMLAYINQEEADLLKARGGSGKPHADTGVPSFDITDYQPESQYTGGGYGDAENLGTVQYAAPQTESIFAEGQNKMAQLGYDYSPTGVVSAKNAQASGQAYVPSIYENPNAVYGQQTDADIAAAGERFKTPTELGFAPGGSFAPTVDPNIVAADSSIPTPREQGFAPGGSTPTEKGFFESMTPATKARLGIGGLQAVLGAYQSQQAAEQGRQAKEEMAAMAAPYQQQGKKLIEQAQKGELSPVNQQQLQAVQAQAAQGAQARGGVGAQQAQAQVEAYRQQLLQGQYDYGLKIAGIGDQIMTGAIKTGMQADQYVNQLTGNYYNNIARAMYGQAPQTSGQPLASTTAGQ